MNHLRYISSVLLVLSVVLVSCNGRQIEPSRVRIVLSDSEPEPLKLAVATLCEDFEKVTGVAPSVVSSPEEAEGFFPIVVINRGNDVGGSFDGPEAHRVCWGKGRRSIFLEGADMRGAIYAVYTFSEKILGVPPLWYWCSWVPQHKDRLDVPGSLDFCYSSPKVRYRSWLPNDTDLWSRWIWRNKDNDEAVYETMLRLKLNTLECGGLGYPGITHGMQLCKKYGLVVTSHHIYMLNTTFSDWGRYWRNIRHMDPPELILSNEDKIVEFWEYGARTVVENDVENLWNISFRGSGDQPFWILFKDAPESEEERAAVINRMLRKQVEIIKKYSGEDDPVIRMTFYDEMADLVNRHLVIPPEGKNMIWTFCSGRRDHYPYDDIQSFNPATPVKLGYYMNLQFTSTGSHLAPGEGPWKMEFNYRYVDSKSPLFFSVVNSGNFREFLFTMSANAAMLWDYDSYSTDRWIREYTAQYFGEEYAQEAADIYRDYFYSYWCQRKSDFPGGMDRQFIFHDNRHAKAIHYISRNFTDYKEEPLPRWFGYERVEGRVFRIVPEDNGVNTQVDALIKGAGQEEKDFAEVVRRARSLSERLPEDRRAFLYDNLTCYALFMQHLSSCLFNYVTAYKGQGDREFALGCLDKAYDEMLSARQALLDSQRGVFSEWYKADRLFNMQNVLDEIDNTRKLLNK